MTSILNVILKTLTICSITVVVVAAVFLIIAVVVLLFLPSGQILVMLNLVLVFMRTRP